VIPAWDVEAAIVAGGLAEGTNQLDSPPLLEVLWYEIYETPGTGKNSFFAGGGIGREAAGPFENLSEYQPGDEIVITMENGSEFKYVVVSNTRYDVATIPTGELIYPTVPRGEEWITLITWGGEWSDEQQRYLSRDVAVAARPFP